MSNVSNAMGTQRQFSPMPQSTYEKRLHNIDIAADTSNNGLLLAKSLGALGEARQVEGLSQENRREKIGIAKGQRFIASRTEEDIRKRTAIEMLNDSGDFKTAENPYAISTIENMRGKFLGAEAKGQYEIDVIQAQGHANTAEEEVARYNKYIQEKYGEFIKTTSDETAFNKGFYDNHIVDQLEVVNKQIQYKSAELDATRIGTTQAALSKLVETAHTMSNEELLTHYNEIMADNRMANASVAERILQTRQFMKDLTEMTGDSTKLEYLMDNGVLRVDAKGNPVHVGSIINGQEFKRGAEIRTRQLFGERIQRDILALQKMTPDQVNTQYEAWKKDDPEWYNVMVEYRHPLFAAQQQAEKTKQIKQEQQSIAKAVRQASFQHLENQWIAYQAGNNKDALKYDVATSYEDLPAFDYDAVDANGQIVAKKYAWNKEDVSLFVDNKLKQIINNPDLTPEARAAETMKLLAWPPAKHYSASIKMQLGMAIDALTTGKLKTDEQGQAIISDQAQDAIQLYRADSEAFQHLFGSALTNEMETIQLLTQAVNDTRQGVALYALARDKRKDANLVGNVEAQVATTIASKDLTGFLGLDGVESTDHGAIATNQAVMKRVSALAQNLMYIGKTSEEAVDMAIAKVKENTYLYGNTVIPRTIFNGIMTENKAAVGKAVLDYYVDDFAAKTKVAKQHITVDYDIDHSILTLYGGNGYVSYNINNITYSGNYLLQEWAKNPLPQGNNITLQEVQNFKRSKFNFSMGRMFGG